MVEYRCICLWFELFGLDVVCRARRVLMLSNSDSNSLSFELNHCNLIESLAEHAIYLQVDHFVVVAA